ncbi:MAG: hypothetical protein HYZ53_11035 [Planctomycetes bacterium]|nr:hypothetical protein [Planctomycetota bacterium]
MTSRTGLWAAAAWIGGGLLALSPCFAQDVSDFDRNKDGKLDAEEIRLLFAAVNRFNARPEEDLLSSAGGTETVHCPKCGGKKPVSAAPECAANCPAGRPAAVTASVQPIATQPQPAAGDSKSTAANAPSLAAHASTTAILSPSAVTAAAPAVHVPAPTTSSSPAANSGATKTAATPPAVAPTPAKAPTPALAPAPAPAKLPVVVVPAVKPNAGAPKAPGESPSTVPVVNVERVTTAASVPVRVLPGPALPALVPGVGAKPATAAAEESRLDLMIGTLGETRDRVVDHLSTLADAYRDAGDLEHAEDVIGRIIEVEVRFGTALIRARQGNAESVIVEAMAALAASRTRVAPEPPKAPRADAQVQNANSELRALTQAVDALRVRLEQLAGEMDALRRAAGAQSRRLEERPTPAPPTPPQPTAKEGAARETDVLRARLEDAVVHLRALKERLAEKDLDAAERKRLRSESRGLESEIDELRRELERGDGEDLTPTAPSKKGTPDRGDALINFTDPKHE